MLINLRNALMAGKRLPYDAELEFLESTGTQWIDTGIYQSPTIGAKIDLVITGYTQNTSNIMMSGSDSWRWGFGYIWSTKSLQVSGICASGITWASYPMTENARHSIQYNLNGDKVCYIDGKLTRSGIPTGTVQSPGPIYLFTANYNGTGTSWRPSVMRCYACQIYDGNTLIRDFIPVRKGTVGYLYDRVSGKLFGNAGTGDFVLGPDVVPVEYIESHGTEYIETGVVPNTQNMRIEMTYANGAGHLFGSSINSGFSATNHLWSAYAFNTVECRKDWIGANSYISVAATAKSILFSSDSTGSAITYNGTTETGPTKTTNNLPIVIFGVNTNGTVTAATQMTLYSFKAWKNDVPVRSFRPVRVGTEGAMMDVLTRRIYRNAGTGAFAYGNDLKYPIPAE